MKLLRSLSVVALLLAFFVVMLGAFTRLTDAGLGCPDWPGCYGQLVLSGHHQDLIKAQQMYPHSPIETRKAWTEMAHRYAAGTLASLIIIIFFVALRLYWQRKLVSCLVPCLLLGLVFFQAALGMWTVTLKLLPIVVMGHLLGGMLIFSLLCYLCSQLMLGSHPALVRQPILQALIPLGLLIVFCQIALGGWVSANYAGIACIGFPTCNGQWLPHLVYGKGFHLFSTIGANYQGGLLDNDSRVTIQMIHRMGALVTALYGFALSVYMLLKIEVIALRRVAWLIMLLIVVQWCLGIANVVYLLPLWVAVAHNGVAALLLGSWTTLLYFIKGAWHARST